MVREPSQLTFNRGGDGQKSKSAPKRYFPPPVKVGMIVAWYQAGEVNDQQPYPAIVTHVGALTVALSVISKDSMTFNTRDGVPHIEDPRLRGADARENGAWDYTEEQKEVVLLSADIGRLKEDVAGLAASLANLARSNASSPPQA